MPKKGDRDRDQVYTKLAVKYRAQGLEDWMERAYGEAYQTTEEGSFQNKARAVKTLRPRGKTHTVDKWITNPYLSSRRLHLKLEELKDAYGIGWGEVIFRLFSPDKTGVNLPIVVHQLRDLPLIQARLRFYQEVLNLHEEHLKHYQQARGEVSGDIEAVENLKEAALLEENLILLSLIEKVCRRGKYLRDLAERMKLSRGKRRNNPQQWDLIGDVAVDLYEYLAKKTPADRKAKRGKIGRSGPRRYKQRALALTAELMMIAYSPYIHELELTSRDIRSRLQQRRRRPATAR